MPRYDSLNRDYEKEQQKFIDKMGRWKESKQTVPTFYIPMDYADCFTQYLPPQWNYVVCPNFGKCEILDVQCHRCHDLFFYQWAMCQDETWILQLMQGGRDEKTAKYGVECSRDEAQLHVMRYKKMLFDLNFANNADLAYEDFNKNLAPEKLIDRLAENKPKNYKSPEQVAAEAKAEKERLAQRRIERERQRLEKEKNSGKT